MEAKAIRRFQQSTQVGIRQLSNSLLDGHFDRGAISKDADSKAAQADICFFAR